MLVITRGYIIDIYCIKQLYHGNAIIYPWESFHWITMDFHFAGGNLRRLAIFWMILGYPHGLGNPHRMIYIYTLYGYEEQFILWISLYFGYGFILMDICIYIYVHICCFKWGWIMTSAEDIFSDVHPPICQTGSRDPICSLTLGISADR